MRCSEDPDSAVQYLACCRDTLNEFSHESSVSFSLSFGRRGDVGDGVEAGSSLGVQRQEGAVIIRRQTGWAPGGRVAKIVGLTENSALR